MTKKHFEAIADTLRSVRPTRPMPPYGESLPPQTEAQTLQAQQWELTLFAFADLCASQNPLFNKTRFIQRATLPK